LTHPAAFAKGKLAFAFLLVLVAWFIFASYVWPLAEMGGGYNLKSRVEVSVSVSLVLLWRSKQSTSDDIPQAKVRAPLDDSSLYQVMSCLPFVRL
jgi:hypothetical protein